MFPDARDEREAMLLEFTRQHRLPFGIGFRTKFQAEGIAGGDERTTRDATGIVQRSERRIEPADLQRRRRVASYVVIRLQVGLDRVAWNL